MESCAILRADASEVSDLSPSPRAFSLGLDFAFAFGSARFFVRHRQCACVAEFVDAAQRAGADAVQQVCLPRLRSNEPAEDIQQIQQVGRILGQPMIGLN